MLNPSKFPLLESFEIEIVETWLEGDMAIKQPIKKFITDLSEVGEVRASFADPKFSDHNTINLTAIFCSCYHQKLPEKSEFKSYTDSRKIPQSDDGRITRKISCRIKYKVEKIEVRDLATPDKN